MSTILYMSSAVQVAIWHVQTKQAGADRPNHSEAEKKFAFPSIEYVSVLRFKDETTWLPVTAHLVINSLKAEFMVA